jgi:hypothetical protein
VQEILAMVPINIRRIGMLYLNLSKRLMRKYMKNCMMRLPVGINEKFDQINKDNTIIML